MRKSFQLLSTISNKVQGERFKVRGGGVYKVQGGGVYKVQGPENFSGKGRL